MFINAHTISAFLKKCHLIQNIMTMVPLPDNPSYLLILFSHGGSATSTSTERWERGGTPRRPNSRATLQGLDQRSKMEDVVPKMALLLHQRLATSTWWCGPRPSLERWAKIARQLPRGARPSGRPNRLFSYRQNRF